jgi:myosin heavy subunit
LLSLGEFNEGALLHTIRNRHSRKQIYTSIGTPILLSVNPYAKLKIFTTFIARMYRQYSNSVKGGCATEKPEPHLFMVAEDSY